MCVARSALVIPWLNVSAGVSWDCEPSLFTCAIGAVSQVYIAGDVNAELQRFAKWTRRGQVLLVRRACRLLEARLACKWVKCEGN